MKLIPRSIVIRNSKWKRDILLPYLLEKEKVLDFGCGDLALAKSLKRKVKSLSISGVDVVNFPNQSGIPFYTYDGKKLPFHNNSFDTVIAFYVLHHCDSAEVSFKECLRVAKKRVLIVESLPRNSFEMPFVKLMDWVYNIIKPEQIPLSYQFHSLADWKKIFKKNKAKLKSKTSFSSATFPILTVGEQAILEVVKSQ